MTKEMETILKQVELLPTHQQAELLKILERKLAIPLKEPHQVFDDWDDTKVDEAYGEAR